MKLFKQTVAFDYSKAPNKHDYVLWGIQAKLASWRIRLGVFGGIFLVIINSYYVISAEGIEFVFQSNNPIFNIGRLVAILVVGISYLICVCFAYKYAQNQDHIFSEVTKDGFR